MKMLCLLAQRTLSALAASGADVPPKGWLSRHLSACAECRQAQQSFRDIAAALSASEPVAVPDDLVARAMGRMEARTQSPAGARSLRRRVVMASGAAGLVCMLSLAVWFAVGRRGDSGTPAALRVPVQSVARAEGVSRPSPPRDHSGARPKPRLKELRAEPAPPPRGSVQRQEHEEQLRRLLERARRKMAKARAAPGHRDGDKPGGTAVEQTTRADPVAHDAVLEVAAYYESAQDYRHAALAYGLVARDAWSPAIALAAGRTAEAVGDYTTAVIHYRCVLEAGTGWTPNRVDTPR